MNIKAEAGESTFSVIKRAIEYAKISGNCIGVVHNDITVSVYPQSYIHDIAEKMHYLREYTRLNTKKITS